MQMVYGQVLRDGELLSLAANIDVVAHEIFHGVTDHTSRLEYAFQPGALNESYSDIFGTIIANLGNDDPRTWDWLLGERLLPGDKPFRDLSDPPRFGQPDHMDDFKVLPDTQEGDWGGVHINSGIHNKAAFNLLTAENGDGELARDPRRGGRRVLPGADPAAVPHVAVHRQPPSGDHQCPYALPEAAGRRSSDRRSRAIEAAFDAVGIA